MVNQYPHTVLITTQNSDAAVDGDGNPVEGANSSLSLNGRFETARSDTFVSAASGTQVAYKGIVYLPLPCPQLAPGADVVVKKGAVVIASGTVRQFLTGEYNARLWV